jgi:Ca2+-binding EF-hand superfamily protein
VHAELQRRFRRLFRFYDVDGDGRLRFESDGRSMDEAIAARWPASGRDVPDLLPQLLGYSRHEMERRDLNHDGSVDEQEFVDSHAPMLAAYAEMPEQAVAFCERAAGAFFDVLDLDRDGVLVVEDLQAYARACRKPVVGIAANLARMLAAFGLPPDRLPRAVFLTLVRQFWFDPSPDVPGRWLFCLDAAVGGCGEAP